MAYDKNLRKQLDMWRNHLKRVDEEPADDDTGLLHESDEDDERDEDSFNETLPNNSASASDLNNRDVTLTDVSSKPIAASSFQEDEPKKIEMNIDTSMQRKSVYTMQKEKRLAAAEQRRQSFTPLFRLGLSTPSANNSSQHAPFSVPCGAARLSENVQCEATPQNAARTVDSGYLSKKNVNSSSADLPTTSVSFNSTVPPTRSLKNSVSPFLPATPASVAATPSSSSCVDRDGDYIVINNRTYRVLNLLGKGGSSKVYQVFDEEQQLCLALKCVDLSEADDVVRTAYLNEISLLERLQIYPNRVVRMFDYAYVKEEGQLYVVMEKGDTDLASFFSKRKNEKLPDYMILFYWLEMLEAVHVIHKEGIVHSDLKPANFLLVAGNLKLIDFGIASTVPSNKTSVTRGCQMGTLNYMSPEAVSSVQHDLDNNLRVSTKSDVWSLGCILYNMVYGRTPFYNITNGFVKMAAILNPKHRIPFPALTDADLYDVMRRCLERDIKQRPTTEELLQHPYVRDRSRAKTSVLSDDTLRILAATVGKNSPGTGARLIKEALMK